MGFFSSKPKSTYTDKVWKADSFCMQGMITDALLLIKANEIPVVICNFSDNQERLHYFLSGYKAPYFLVEKGNEDEAWQQSQVVYLVDWRMNGSTQLLDFLTRLLKKSKTHLLFFGHYPLPTKEKKFLDQLSVIQSPLTKTFYSSLDEPSFRIFTSGDIISLMEKLGMKDEEAISHAMVTKAMERAREKIEDKVKLEQEASSEKEWFQKNMKR